MRLAQTMKEQNYTPDMFLLDPIGGYSKAFTDGAGAAAENAYVYIDSALFEEAGNNAEMQLYLHVAQAGRRQREAGLLRAVRVVCRAAVRHAGREGRS